MSPEKIVHGMMYQGKLLQPQRGRNCAYVALRYDVREAKKKTSQAPSYVTQKNAGDESESDFVAQFPSRHLHTPYILVPL